MTKTPDVLQIWYISRCELPSGERARDIDWKYAAAALETATGNSDYTAQMKSRLVRSVGERSEIGEFATPRLRFYSPATPMIGLALVDDFRKLHAAPGTPHHA
jgi:hypothetical protein